MDHSGLRSLDDYFSWCFDPVDPYNREKGLYKSVWAYCELAKIYAAKTGIDPTFLVIDHHSLADAMDRFHRDAYGLTYLEKILNVEHQSGHSVDYSKVKEKGLDPKTAKIVLDHMAKMGLRINSAEPRKTRVAAAFALWMATLRPITVDSIKVPSDKKQGALLFSSSLVIWATDLYLYQFGDISYGQDGDEEDEAIRRSHIIRDLHCRALRLSVLELFFCSIFRPSVHGAG